MGGELEFKWVWKVPDLRNVKQPDILTPDQMLSLIARVNNEGVDPLLGLRNQTMLAMTYFSCFRAIEVSQWLVKEAMYPDGSICKMTKLRKEGTKGKYPARAPVVLSEQRELLEQWFDARVKHKICLLSKDKQTGKYRDLDPESHVFLSNYHNRWQPFSLTHKVVKGNVYRVATAVQNLLSGLYKDYGHPRSSSHAGRHSMARFAQQILEKRADPDARRIIQNLMHHTSEETQKDYTDDIDFEHIRRCSENLMPKPKKRGPKPKK